MSGSTNQRARFLRGLHAEARKRGLSHDDLHELVARKFRVDSLSKLTEKQLREWYREFTGKGFKHRGVPAGSRAWASGNAGRRGPGQQKVVELVNGDDLAMLANLAAQIGWSVSALHVFIERQIGRRAIRTMAEFNRVLWPMKAIARRKGIAL